MLDIPLSGIKKIEEVAQSNSDFISLSQGSIKVGGIPQQIKTYIQDLLNSDKTDYYESCWGIKALREKIATTLSKRYNTSISLQQVIPTHGCIGGLSLIYLTLLNPGDEVIIPEPSYPAYHILAQAARCNTVFVSSTQEDKKHPWGLNIEKIKSATTAKTKLIVFSNPWNPLGVIVPEKQILELINWCDQKGIYLIIDEAYREYVFDSAYTSAVTLLNKSDRVICANSFSKNMAMSGWRVGYLLVAEHLIKPLAGMQDALLNCLNNTAQYAALYALDHPELTQAMHQKVLHNRNTALKLLEPLFNRNIFTSSIPQGGFFLFLQTPYEDATDLCMNILYQAKVGLIPGKSFGPTGSSYLRLCFARDTQILQEGITRIVNYLA